MRPEPSRANRDWDHHNADSGHDDYRYRRRDSPGHRDRFYRDRDAPRERYNRSPRRGYSHGHSPHDSGDEGHYRERSYRSGPGKPYHTLKLDGVPDRMSQQEVRLFEQLWNHSFLPTRSCQSALTSSQIDFALRDIGAAGLVEVRVRSDDRSG
jgi:RNA-binding protein 5/10